MRKKRHGVIESVERTLRTQKVVRVQKSPFKSTSLETDVNGKGLSATQVEFNPAICRRWVLRSGVDWVIDSRVCCAEGSKAFSCSCKSPDSMPVPVPVPVAVKIPRGWMTGRSKRCRY